jgi:hypothetical protein
MTPHLSATEPPLARSHGIRLTLVLAALLQTASCKPGPDELARLHVENRKNCSDNYCQGDTFPPLPPNRSLLKMNDRFYSVPREYGAFNNLGFYWPSKTPQNSSRALETAPELARSADGRILNSQAVLINVFLTGRQRWPTPEVKAPWEARGWDQVFQKLQAQGFTLQRRLTSSALEVVTFIHPDGTRYDRTYYLASSKKRLRGPGAPGISCYVSHPPHHEDTCTGGEFWREAVYVDFRFSSRHASDWPAIYDEIVRVLGHIEPAT